MELVVPNYRLLLPLGVKHVKQARGRAECSLCPPSTIFCRSSASFWARVKPCKAICEYLRAAANGST